MTVFVDTSALFAVLDRNDGEHSRAGATFRSLLAVDRLVTHSYIVVETEALARARLGIAASRVLVEGVLPAIETIWVDESLHRAAVAALLSAARRRLSLVDCVSFEVMRRERIDRAFTFDRDFETVGLLVVP